eukprot:s94_g29.t1
MATATSIHILAGDLNVELGNSLVENTVGHEGNKQQHACNGNTAQQRTRWESTVDTQGIQLHCTDELKFPGDAVLAVLRADQVSNGAVGCAFVTQLFLPPKLAVRGDPQTGKIFPRSVVCVNLGLQNVTPADLEPQVDLTEEQSTVVCVSCFAKYNSEGWDSILGATLKLTRWAVIEKVRSLTKLASFDFWGLKVDSIKNTLICFVRVPEDKAKILFDSKDAIFFFRPFVSPTNPPTQEPGVHIVWANKIHSTQALLTVTNTLAGVRGFVANSHSLGIRVEKAGIASARKALQHPTMQYTTSNFGVAGTLKFVARGFPQHLSANTVIQCFATPASNSAWKAWHVIPFRSIMQGFARTWYLKVDVPPSHERLVLPEGWKITISPEPTSDELFKQKVQEKAKQNELAKEERRQRILSEQQTPTVTDPWAPWNANHAPGKGKSKSKGAPSTPKPRAETAEDSQISALQREIERLNRRVNAQDSRLHTIEQNMTHQHSEVMHALRSLGAASSPKTISKKREPELQNTPLRAITEGDGPKIAKGKGHK